MLVKDITYDDIDGDTQTETFWFQLTEAEVSKNIVAAGDATETYEQRLNRLGNMTQEDLRSGGAREVIDTFDGILKDAVGKREGKLFRKTEAIRDQFLYSGAYDAFFMELLTTPDSGASYIRAMLPRKAQAEFTRLVDQQTNQTVIELPNSGTIETTAAPTPFPESLEKAIQHNSEAEAGKDGPVWLAEKRYPTDEELKHMSQAELVQAFNAKSSKLFG